MKARNSFYSLFLCTAELSFLNKLKEEFGLNRGDKVNVHVSCCLICIDLLWDFDVWLICEECFTNDLTEPFEGQILLFRREKYPAGKSFYVFTSDPKNLWTALMVIWSHG